MDRILEKLLKITFLAAIACAVFGVSAERCQASCGDYLVHSGGDVAVGHDDPSDPAKTPARPCHGPSCSRRSDVPPLPNRPTTVEIPNELACVIEQIRDAKIPKLEALLESELLVAGRSLSCLEHPPKSRV